MPNPAILSYTFQPPEVFVATTISLKLVIENPAGGSVITFKGGPQGDEIDINFPAGNGDTDLVTTLNFTAQAPSGYSCAKSSSGNYFAIKFLNNTTKLQPGQRIEITFVNVTINPTYTPPSSIATIKITEFIGANEGAASVDIDKNPNTQLGIIAWLDPSTIALYQQATLYWQSVGGTSVVVTPFSSGDKTFPVVGPPPSPGNCKVNIPSSVESQRVYTLTVFTSDQQHQAVNVALTQNPPVITSFESDKSGSIAVDDTMTLDWSYLWGTTVIIDSNSGLQLNSPNPTVIVNPGTEVAQNYKNNYANMPASVYYELTVNGFQKPAYKKISVNLLPVQFLYFKFGNKDAQGKLSGMQWSVFPNSWVAKEVRTVNNNLSTLTLYQPGGTSQVYYLGSGDTTHPQVQYFDFTDKGSGNFELSWVTANLVSLVLMPGNIVIASANIASGTTTVPLAITTVYTATGTAADGSVIISKLNVTVQS